MTTQAIFGLQFGLSLLAWIVVARVLLLPRLHALPQREVLLWLTLPHVFRHVAMVFLVPGVVAEPLPVSFAVTAACGDLLAGILALGSVVLLHSRRAGAIVLIWVFNIVGAVDLANALRAPEPIGSFGAAWFIPTFIVPLLLVTHAVSFRELLRTQPAHRTHAKLSTSSPGSRPCPSP